MTCFTQRFTAFAIAAVLATAGVTAFAQTSQPPPQSYPPPGQPYPPQPQPYPPPPQYVYAPQPQPQPYATQYQYPATLPYDEGRPVPQGYHTRTSVRKGLIIGGSITFGVLYIFSLLAADTDRKLAKENGDSQKLDALYIPGIGPFIATGNVGAGSSSILIIDGLGQCAGLFMFVAGFAFPKTELVRNDLGAIRVMPLMGRGQSGLSLVGSF